MASLQFWPPLPRRPWLWLLVCLLGACATPAPPNSPLPDAIGQRLRGASIDPSALALVAIPLHDPSQALEWQAHVPMQPGSTMKLVTAAVALERLGPTARARTDVLASPADIDGPYLHGPLYLRGGADTDLDWGALWGLLRGVRERGIRELRGGVVVDRTLFEPARSDLNQPPFDASPEFAYNVVPDALHLNGSLLDFELRSDDQLVQASASPALPRLQLDTQSMVLVDRPCAQWELGWKLPTTSLHADGSARVAFAGEFPRHCQQRLTLNVLDRQWMTRSALDHIWQQLGGAPIPRALEGHTPATATVLGSHQGRALGEWLWPMMKRSDNALSRLAYLRLGLGEAQAGEPSDQASARVVRAWLAAKGIDANGLVLDNGSGLSRSERITAASMAALLHAMHKAPYGAELRASLPLAGVDGTLTRRFRDSPVRGRARLKTGSLRNVVALAGYVQDRQDRPWVVVAMLNHENAATAGWPILEACVLWVAQQP